MGRVRWHPLSYDGTPPLRAVVRCLANPSSQLWHKGSNQSLFRPQDLHITHICIYAVRPTLAHAAHSTLEVADFKQWEDNSLITAPGFVPVCRAAAAALIGSPQEADKYPVHALCSKISKTHKPDHFEAEHYEKKTFCPSGTKDEGLVSELAARK